MKIFGEYDTVGIKINDLGLVRYINLDVYFIPKTCGREQKKKFWKSRMSIVERLMNKLYTPGHKGKKHLWTSGRCTGKSHKVYNIIKKTLKIIEKRTKQSPLQVLVLAIENSAPRAEVTVIEYGGIRHPKAVDVAPQRRVDLALRWIVQGSYVKTVNKKTSMENVLANEIISAAKNEKCFPTSKKMEVERQAAASR